MRCQPSVCHLLSNTCPSSVRNDCIRRTTQEDPALCNYVRLQKPQENNSKHQNAEKEEIRATNQRPIGTTNIHGLCLFLCHNLGILYQILKWSFRIGAKFSPHLVHAPGRTSREVTEIVFDDCPVCFVALRLTSLCHGDWGPSSGGWTSPVGAGDKPLAMPEDQSAWVWALTPVPRGSPKPRRGGRACSLYATPPPPRVLKDSGAGAMVPTAPIFLSHA